MPATQRCALPPHFPKTCAHCQQEKICSEFSRDPKMLDGYRSYCRSCRVEFQRQWRLANPEIAKLRNRAYARANPVSQRPRHLRRRYDIELAEYQRIAESQGGACAICRTPAGDTWNMQVDHCHQTGKIRGLLCHKCNKGIGLLGDDPERIAAALRYLITS